MKKLLATVICAVCLLSLMSCASHIEDTNGAENTSLCSLTDEDIIDGTSSVAQKSVSNKRNDRGSMRIEKFSGVQLVDSMNVRDKAETLTCTVNLKSGNFRVVIVKDGKIFADIKTDGTEDSVTLTQSGKYELKIAGESANFEMEYKIK